MKYRIASVEPREVKIRIDGETRPSARSGCESGPERSMLTTVSRRSRNKKAKTLPERHEPMKCYVPTLVVLLLAFQTTAAHADVKLPPVISDHMVLHATPSRQSGGLRRPARRFPSPSQARRKRQPPTPRAIGGASRSVEKCRGAHTHRESREHHHHPGRLVGEVWLGSGQSNMAGTIRNFKLNDEGLQKLLAAAPYPRIRFIKSGGTGWQLATPDNVDGYSGAALRLRIAAASGTRCPRRAPPRRGRRLAIGLLADRGDVSQRCRMPGAGEGVRGDVRLRLRPSRTTSDYSPHGRRMKRRRSRTAAKSAAPTPPAKAGELPAVSAASTRSTSGLTCPTPSVACCGIKAKAARGSRGVDQFHVMGALIRGWRKDWGRDFPFLYVQKPSGGGTAWDLDRSDDEEREQVQPAARKGTRTKRGYLPRNLHQDSAASQHGDGHEHRSRRRHASLEQVGLRRPGLPRGPGIRLWQKVEISGPLYASHAIEGNKVRLKFTHVGQGLAVASRRSTARLHDRRR